MRSMKHSDALRMETLVALPEAMTYSAMIVDGEIESGEQVITELMMRRACELMHDEQQFPFCSANSTPLLAKPARPANQPCALNQGSFKQGLRSAAKVHRLDDHRSRKN